MKKQAISAAELLLTAFIWGVAFVAQSVGMDYIGPFTFNCVRSIIGGLVLIPLVVILGKKNRADKTAEEEKEYKKAFIGELYPIDDVVSNEGIKISGNSYYKYFETQYDCYIAYDRNAEPNVYFGSEHNK